jgi:hypothetical protein
VAQFAAVQCDIFSTVAKFVADPKTNGTAIDLLDPISLHYIHSLNISVLFIVLSALLAFFTILTVSMRDNGLDGQSITYEDYTTLNVDLITNPTITLWNNVFLAIVVTTHGLIFSVVNSPTSMHLLLLCCLLVYMAMKVRTVYPVHSRLCLFMLVRVKLRF